MRFSNVREFKSKTSEMLRNVAHGAPIVITLHGKPKPILLGIQEENDLEDLLLAYDPVLRKKIEEGLEDIRKGRVIPLSLHMAKKSKHSKK